MKLLIFDIDGTLARTNAVDRRLFGQALRSVVPSAVVPRTEDLVEATDAAILRQACSEFPGLDFDSVEAAVQRHLFAGIETAVETEPDSFRAIPGAQTVFGAARSAGWTVAMATGAWRPSAELKLATAEIPIQDVPLATSSEAVRRVDILRRAIRKTAPSEDPKRIVYVGDGTWDVRACRELGIGFVGRSDPEHAGRLTALGARTILPDFTDVEVLLTRIEDPAASTLSAL